MAVSAGLHAGESLDAIVRSVGTKPVYSQDGIVLFVSDCADILPRLPDGCVNACLCDPPYNVSEVNADVRFKIGGGRTRQKPRNDTSQLSLAAWQTQPRNNIAEVSKARDFGEWDRAEWEPTMLLEQTERLLKPGGSLLSFCSDRLITAYRTAPGLNPRGTIVWEKTNPPPMARPGYVQATEWIIWLAKPGAAATWNGSGFQINVLRYPICAGEERGDHPTQKPESLIADLMQRHTNPGDLVLDPYCGSGTTLRVARDLGRRCIGIERDPQWVPGILDRLRQNALALEVPNA